jgi:Asp-tRNA(Asn)/Glu-tRNA(Gln) amidotransferase A subunit family amidase
MPTPLNELTASEIVVALNSGATTCEAVLRACLERIEEREPEVGAWQSLRATAAIEEARALDRNGRHGALLGVPFGVKDIIDTCDTPSEYGSEIYVGHQPKADAACVALTRKASGVLMGKTVTTEFANRHPGKTRNPLDLARTPGGSSSGSAAAVADRMIPIAIGTQTTGSSIKPGSFCGIFAYKPTFGDLSCSGVKQSAGSLDTLGLFARSIDDIALFRDALLGIDPAPITFNDESAPRIGLCRTPYWSEIEPSTQKLFEDAAGYLSQRGARVSDVVLPKEFDQIRDVQKIISAFEFSQNYTWEIQHHWNAISSTLRTGRLKAGLACDFEHYSASRRVAEYCRRSLETIFAEFDLLFTPATSGEAPRGLEETGNSSLCGIWTTMHVPAVTIPVFRGPAGLPVGAQLIGARDNDRNLLRFAKWIYRRMT